MLAVHQREETAQLGGVLHFGPGLKAFPIAMIVVWIVLLLWIKLVTDPPPASPGDRLYVLAVLILFVVILPWIMFLEAFGTRVVLSQEGIQMDSFWRGTRLMRWEDVESIHFSLWKWGFIVKSHDDKLVLRNELHGLALFAEAVDARLPREKWVKASGRLRILLPKGPYD